MPNLQITPYAFEQRWSVRTKPVSLAQYWVWIVLIVLIALIPRLWGLAETDIWTDEMLTMQRVEAPLTTSIDSITSAGNQIPLYYLVLRLIPHTDPFWLRLPSMIFGLLNIVLLFYMVAALYEDRILALQVAALVAVNPLHIILSRTARYYTVLLTLVIINMVCFVLILRGRRSWKLWFILGLSSMLAYLVHYTTLALPVAQGIVLLLMGRKHRRLLWQWGKVQFARSAATGWMVILAVKLVHGIRQSLSPSDHIITRHGRVMAEYSNGIGSSESLVLRTSRRVQHA